MCRNIHLLRDIDRPATQEEIHLAALQYIRKVSGYHKPSQMNQDAFDAAVQEVAAATTALLASLKERPSRRSPLSDKQTVHPVSITRLDLS